MAGEFEGSPQEFYDFLQSSVADRGVVALDALVDLAVHERNVFIKGPCVAAMAFWDEVGVAAIANFAVKHTGSKNISQALRVLSTIASGRPLGSLTAFIHSNVFLEALNNHLRDGHLVMAARLALHDLAIRVPTEDLLIPMGTAFTQVGMSDPEIAGEIVQAISKKWLKFGTVELEEFRNLLDVHPSDEPALHSFLERFPQVLDPMAVEVWSKPDFHGAREPDFLIRRSDNTYLVVEIENASKSLITQGLQPSAATTQAIQQANDYRAFLEERIPEARQHFFGINVGIEALVVIGMERSLAAEQAKVLARENGSRSRTRIVGFDWLVARSGIVLENITSGHVSTKRGYRVI